MAEKVYNESEAMVWIQPEGPNTVTETLDCHDIADISVPAGDTERSYCVNAVGGGYILSSRKQGPAGAPTTSLTAHVGLHKDWVTSVMGCPTSFYVHKVSCGDRRVFGNYERDFLLRGCLVTQRTLTGLGTLMSLTGAPADSAQTWDLEPLDVTDIFKLVQTSHENAEAEVLLDIAGCQIAQCQGWCGPKQEHCDTLVATATAAAVATANVYYSLDHGVTWTASATDPLAADEDAMTVVCFMTGDGKTLRTLVGAGTAGAGGASVGWTDDNGATAWTVVTVGVTVGSLFLHSGGLFALDERHIWAGLDDGDIFFSSDGGLTWTEQSPGVTTDGIYMIKFLDENYGMAVGANGLILFTRDGGTHWNVIANPAALNAAIIYSCDILDPNRAFIGTALGTMYSTVLLDENMAITDWVIKNLPAEAASWAGITRVNDIMFLRDSPASTNDHIGFVAVQATDDAAGERAGIYRTINGGFDWEKWYTEDLDAGVNGYNAIWTCGPNEAFAVGDLLDALAVITSVDGAQPS